MNTYNKGAADRFIQRRPQTICALADLLLDDVCAKFTIKNQGKDVNREDGCIALATKR